MWTYDPTQIDTETSTGQLYAVRLLVGDTDTEDQQLQDEEINFSLFQSGYNVYSAGSFSCSLISAKYSRMVSSQLDGALQAEYSDRIKHYNMLATQLTRLGKRSSLGIGAGITGNSSSFWVGQFDGYTGVGDIDV